jgi:hypothetical protein
VRCGVGRGEVSGGGSVWEDKCRSGCLTPLCVRLMDGEVGDLVAYWTHLFFFFF